MRLLHVLSLAAALAATLTPAAAAQTGQRITEVRVEQEGQPVGDPAVLALIETAVGEPLSRADVEETIRHLFSLGQYEDIQPHAEASGDGVRLRYVLVPSHPVDRVELRGTLGLDEGDLRRLITERFGAAPPERRADEVAAALRVAYRERGYPRAVVTPRVEATHAPGHRSTLILDLDAGPRAQIAEVRLTQTDAGDPLAVAEAPAVRARVPYDAAAIDRELRSWEQRMRDDGYYEASASHKPEFDPEGRSVFVFVNVRRGPRVVVEFAGDPIPGGDRDRLVPIREQRSADEDLLEDSKRAIEAYFQARGYRDVAVGLTREDSPALLRIVFTVTRGPRYVIRSTRVEGATAVPAADIDRLLGMRAGDPFDPRRLAAAEQAITASYHNTGFNAMKVSRRVDVQPAAPGADREVDVLLTIVEGARADVRTVAFKGVRQLEEGQVRGLATLRPGVPYSDLELVNSRDRIELEYRNRGFENVVVTAERTFVEDGRGADILFAVSEGTQSIVDDIIVVGNERTDVETIRRELEIASGQPLGLTALANTRSRLAALGLFRRIEIEPLAPGSDLRRDVIVRVQELDPRTFGSGGGIEGGFVTRTGPNGPEERFEVAPRGFLEFGRRNLWGKNRSINVFTGVSLRRRDAAEDGQPQAQETGYGFNQYRIAGTFNEPRIFNSRAQLQVLGIVEQAIRTSFNFLRREVRAELDVPLSPQYRFLGRYSFQRTELFDEKFQSDDEEQALIDRVFPQVRLSKFAGGFLRDTRDDLLDPEHGTFTTFDLDIAARAIGSEVGFIRSLVQSSWYQRLPGRRRMVFAVNGRLGLARGFPREVTRTDDQGQTIVERVDGLPASERFFAGGATSVRGFSLDRLGNEETTGPTGFPTGGNSVVVLMSELRVNLLGSIDGVGFLDAGNVYPRASDLDLTDLRPAAGVGAVYRNDKFGLIRLDLGFNLDRRELVAGTLERGTVWHVSLSQSF